MGDDVRNLNILRHVAVAGLMSLCAHAAAAQGIGEAARLDDSLRTTRTAIADVRAKLRPTRTDREKLILDQIQFTVNSTTSFEAQARYDEERRSITISAGVGILMRALGESMAIGEHGNIPCMQAYQFASIKGYFDGSRRTVSNIADFARIEPTCRGASSLIEGNPQIHAAIEATTRLGITLVILHEIAHHFLNHLDKPPAQSRTPQQLTPDVITKQLARRRVQEDEADKWAFEEAIKLGEPFILATPYLLVMTATTLNNITLEGEESAIHPSGPRRALVILEQLETSMSMLGTTPEVRESIRDTRRQLRAILPQ